MELIPPLSDQVLQQLTQVIANAMAHNAAANANANANVYANANAGQGNGLAKSISARHPPTYLGEEDPRILESWLRTFDKILHTKNCPEHRKVEEAAFYLQEEADLWLMTEAPALQAQANFGWEQFKDAMRERFYPEAVKLEKCSEFINFRQRDQPMQE